MPATPPAMLDTPPAPQIRGAFLADEPKLVGLGEALERRAHIARLGDHGDCGEGAAAATAADRVAEHDRQQYDQRLQDVLLAVEEPSERHEEDRPAPAEYRVPPSRRRPHLLVSLEIGFPVRTEEFGKVRPNPLLVRPVEDGFGFSQNREQPQGAFPQSCVAAAPSDSTDGRPSPGPFPMRREDAQGEAGSAAPAQGCRAGCPPKN